MSVQADPTPAILVERTEGIAHVTLNRSATRNGFTAEMTDAFSRVFPALRDSADLAAVVLTGGPGNFSAGGDMTKLAAASPDVRRHAKDSAEMHAWFRAYLDIPVPVIAAVDGPAFGGGLALVLGADFALASGAAKFSAVFPRIGLVAGLGTAWFLPRMIGLPAARDLLLTGRVVDPEEALRLGLVTELYDSRVALIRRAQEMAERFRDASRGALAGTKELLAHALSEDFDTLAGREIDLQSRALASPAHHAAAQSLLQSRRTPFDWDRREATTGGTQER